jgi:phage-related protein
MSPIRDNPSDALRPIEMHKNARKVIREFSKDVRVEFGSALIKIQLGMSLGLPVSRPMPSVAEGVHEFRFRDASGIQRVFYYVNDPRAILIFHAFVKKTRKTPDEEIKLAQRRLKEMLEEDEEDP